MTTAGTTPVYESHLSSYSASSDGARIRAAVEHDDARPASQRDAHERFGIPNDEQRHAQSRRATADNVRRSKVLGRKQNRASCCHSLRESAVKRQNTPPCESKSNYDSYRSCAFFARVICLTTQLRANRVRPRLPSVGPDSRNVANASTMLNTWLAPITIRS